MFLRGGIVTAFVRFRGGTKAPPAYIVAKRSNHKPPSRGRGTVLARWKEFYDNNIVIKNRLPRVLLPSRLRPKGLACHLPREGGFKTRPSVLFVTVPSPHLFVFAAAPRHRPTTFVCSFFLINTIPFPSKVFEMRGVQGGEYLFPKRYSPPCLFPSQNNTNQAAAAFVDDTFKRFGEFGARLLGHMIEFSMKSLTDELIE